MGAEDTFFADYRRAIENRIREQVDRHRAIDPHTSTKRIIEMQIAQEVEVLRRIAEDDDSKVPTEVVRVIIRWVEQLGRRL